MPFHRALLCIGRRCMRFRRSLLCRIRLAHSHRWFRVHLRLCHARRDLCLDHRLGFNSGVCLRSGYGASGWSGYVLSFLQDFGIRIPARLTAAPSELLISYNGHWEHYDRVKDTLLARGIDWHTLPQMKGLFNLVAFCAIIAVTTILVIGIKESANFNSGIVIVKVSIVLMFIGIAGSFALKHSSQVWANWTPFIPPNAGQFGKYGWSGIARGASVIFFAYIGFDAVSTAAP